MPFTSKDFIVRNRLGKSASPFSGSQFGPVADSPQFSGGNAASHSEVSTDPGSPPSVQSAVSQAAPNDLAPGALDTSLSVTPATGTDSGAAGTSGSDHGIVTLDLTGGHDIPSILGQPKI